jgi:primosomal protein N' (replication factor Y)
MITVVDLARSPLTAPYVSAEFLDSARKVLESDGRILVFFNRRGAYRAFVCKDCSHAFECPRCDLSLALHTSPEKRLVCHHCGHFENVPAHCPKCRGVNLAGIGIGIQTFESELSKRFPDVSILRVDSDASKVSKAESETLKAARIVLSTNLYHRTDPGDFDLVVFPCLDAELVASEYDIEERTYANVRYAAKNAPETLIQTYSPNSPLVQDLSNGGYRQFLERTLAERKKFSYPPYAEIAYVSIATKDRDRTLEAVARLSNKLSIAKKETASPVEIYDAIPLSKRADEWIGKIVVKGKKIGTLLETLRVEIVRNRNIRLEWK